MQRAEVGNHQDLKNIATPSGVRLSGRYKRSFAYVTIKDRLPVILTQVIDNLSRNKEAIINRHGEDSLNEIKHLIGFISKLKNELVTNKALNPLRLNEHASNEEAEEWNKYLIYMTEVEEEVPTWFNTVWLFCECYMYRVLAQEISLMTKLSHYDPFEDAKQTNFIQSIKSINILASFVRNLVPRKELSDDFSFSNPSTKEQFRRLLHVCLWGNRCDLSLSAGDDSSYNYHPLTISESLIKYVLVNHLEYVWDILSKKDEEKCTIDIVLDNAGYELFTDLCLAMFFSSFHIASKVRFYVKKYPWYVSDATLRDFYWTLTHMNNSAAYPDLQFLSKLCFKYIDTGCWSVEEESYWTSPYNFTEMEEKDPKLYAKLSEAKLVIFKGDLNYRKLIADINYHYHKTFTSALETFKPTNILSLRTLKSDICVGLPPKLVEALCKKDKNWMISGKFGLIQANIKKESTSSSDTDSELSSYRSEDLNILTSNSSSSSSSSNSSSSSSSSNSNNGSSSNSD